MPDQPSPPPPTKPAPAAAPRRPWYRLHWSTWIVITAVLAFFALMNLPGRVNNHDAFTSYPLYHEHGWPFVFFDRSTPPSLTPTATLDEDEYLAKDREKTFFPWAESPNGGNLKEGFSDGDPIWLDKNNWSFTGRWYLYQRWLAADILIALFATVPFAAAYEFWSRRRWHYSLRFLLICVFLVAVGMAWWRTGVNRYEREMKAVKALHEKGYDVSLQCDAPTFLRIFLGKNNLRPFTYVDSITQFRDDKESPTPATDGDLEHIGDLTRLGSLWLEYASITDKTLERLPGLTNIKLLSLDNTKITDEGLKTLRDLPNLSSISLDNTKITGVGFKEWKNLPNLQSVSLENTRITDDSLSLLSAFPQLGYLYLSGTKITDAGLRHLMELSNLTALDLSNTKVTDDGLRLLASMPKLTRLYLYDTQVTDAGLKYLETVKQLNSLEIYNTKVTSEGIDKLQRALPNCKIDWSEFKVTRLGKTQPPTPDAEEKSAEKSE
jgi:hypothetical protein